MTIISEKQFHKFNSHSWFNLENSEGYGASGGRLAPSSQRRGRARGIGSGPHPAALELLLPLAVAGEAESCFHTQNRWGSLATDWVVWSPAFGLREFEIWKEKEKQNPKPFLLDPTASPAVVGM